MSANDQSGHAIVLGASIAGLLAARVLSESFAKVTIFDRDELPVDHSPRRGVPQGAHPHGLLARGRQALEELFDDFVPHMTALGALPVDILRDMVWVNDGHRLPRQESGLLGLCVSRPLLEGYVRDRVSQLSNVEIKHRTEALGLLANHDRSRVIGARVLARGLGALPWRLRGVGGPPGEVLVRGDEPQEVHAELVVDATGRGNRGPTWLSQLGYDRPAEEHVDPMTAYMSRDYRRVSGDADFSAIVQGPWPGNPAGAVAIAADGDRWMVTLIGCGTGNYPPSDPEAFLEFTRRLPSQQLYELLSKAEPLGPPMKLRLPASVRRRYEYTERLPEGLIAFGDAICAFNPAYGQGMTVAAAEALELRDCLAKGRNGLPKRFYARAAQVIDVPWDIAVGADLRYEHVAGPRSRKVSFLNSYVGRLHGAAAQHAGVAKAFLSVANLMSPPQTLFKPSVLARVLLSGGKSADISAPVPRPRALEPVA